MIEEGPRARLRRLVAARSPLVVPGAYDGVSARLIEEAGFEAVYMTGYGTSAARLGLPDLGFAGLGDMVENVRQMAAAVSIPLVADADTGYGGVLAVERTVRAYEAAGAAALHIEDQVSPKRCGHLAGKAIVERSGVRRPTEGGEVVAHGPGGGKEGLHGQEHDGVAPRRQLPEGRERALPTRDIVEETRALEAGRDRLDLGPTRRGLDEQNVRAGLSVGAPPGEGVVEARHRARVRPGDDEQIGVTPGSDGCPDLGDRGVGREGRPEGRGSRRGFGWGVGHVAS